MRVLQLGPYPPPHGGVQTNVVAIRQFLRDRQIPCAVINLTRFRQANAEDVYYPRSAFEVLRLLLHLRYGLIHLHIGGNLTPRLLGLAFLCSLLPRKKTVLTFHSGGYPTSKEGRVARRWTLRRFIMRRLDRVIAVNQEIVEFFRKLGVSQERIRLISPYALPAQPSSAPLPEPLHTFFQTHRPVLVTVGLLEPEYDLSLQIVVLGLIRERFPEAGLVIIGAGRLEDKLRRQISRQLHADSILLCGDVPHPVTLRAIAAADLFLRTTLYDGDSIAVREALHLGTPVIATDNGKRPDGVDLIPCADVAALRRTIEQRLAQPIRRQPRVNSDERNLHVLLDLYRELAPKAGKE